MQTDYLSKLISDFARLNCTFVWGFYDSTKIKAKHKFLGFSYDNLYKDIFIQAVTVKVSVHLHKKRWQYFV